MDAIYHILIIIILLVYNTMIERTNDMKTDKLGIDMFMNMFCNKINKEDFRMSIKYEGGGGGISFTLIKIFKRFNSRITSRQIRKLKI